MITKYSGDSGLDPCAVKGIIGTKGETWMVSENHRIVTYGCSFPDFEGSLVAM